MIFKQVEEIINGSKTQTRRICKPGEMEFADDFKFNVTQCVTTNKGRIKWEVGHTYAVCPKRGAAGILIASDGSAVYDADAELSKLNTLRGVLRDYEQEGLGASKWLCEFEEYKPLRIEITGIRRERVNDISREDAIAEGLHFDGQGYRSIINTPGDCISDPRSCYAMLWDSINKRKGQRFSDGPDVWVIEFRVAK